MENILMLDPAVVAADDNIRYGLKKHKVASLLESIIAVGRIRQPLEVEELETPINGHTHRVVTGHYRHAAAVLGNSTQNAGILLPVQVIGRETAVQRMKLQIAENLEREELSYIDQGKSMKQLLEAGESREEIRKVFARPSGKKGNQMTPCSNAYMNMCMSFLDFPKDIKDDIHNGVIGLSGAYQLTKTKRENWEAAIAHIKAERQKLIDQEDKDEEKWASDVAKEQAQTAKLTEAEVAAQALQEENKKLTDAYEAATAEAAAAYTARTKASKEEKEAAEKAFKEKEAAAKAAEKAALESTKKLEKLQGKAKDLKEKAEERRKKLEALRKSAKSAKASKPIAGDEVKKANKAVTGTGNVDLKLADIRAVVDSLCSAASTPKVQAIGLAFKSCFAGVGTDTDLRKALAVIVGEAKPKK